MGLYRPETGETVTSLSRQSLTLPAGFILINLLSTLVSILSLVQYNLTELVQLHTIMTKVMIAFEPDLVLEEILDNNNSKHVRNTFEIRWRRTAKKLTNYR